MGWFNSQQPVPPPVPQKVEPAEALKQRLDTFGLQRLDIHDPDLKMFISRSIWSALPYLNRISGGSPRAHQYNDLVSDLDLLIDTLRTYVTIQNSGKRDADSQDLLQRGSDSVKAWLTKLDPDALGLDTTTYKATTSFLTNG